jgi:hypothetical protein
MRPAVTTISNSIMTADHADHLGHVTTGYLVMVGSVEGQRYGPAPCNRAASTPHPRTRAGTPWRSLKRGER